MSKAILIALVLGIGAGVVMPENVSGFLKPVGLYWENTQMELLED